MTFICLDGFIAINKDLKVFHVNVNTFKTYNFPVSFWSFYLDLPKYSYYIAFGIVSQLIIDFERFAHIGKPLQLKFFV